MSTKRNRLPIALCGMALILMNCVAAEAQQREGDAGDRRVRPQMRDGAPNATGGRRAGDARAGRPNEPREILMRLPVIAALDTDRNGRISAQELDNAVASLKLLDKNGDGEIDMREMTSPGTRNNESATTMIARLMRRDKDSDGFLTYKEMPGLLARIVKRDDKNGDGKLSREEVKESVQALISKRDAKDSDDTASGKRPKQPPLKE
ncbi:EF-hand domain-containing protein [Stieleria marina]|uniref:EF hand n=1 Tax=Stieleria marina TaxID=1930275 RepID=A0A517NV84_9BACT|nr:EF hand [Planctomycetes bacterium K23_9]